MTAIFQRIAGRLKQMGLGPEATKYVEVAANAPARNVGRTAFASMSGAFQSRKMGCSISFESRSGELAYAALLEYDDDVVAYFDQPPMVDCRRVDRTGRAATRSYYPDFLVVRAASVEVVQIKSGQALAKLAEERSVDWKFEDGVYHDLAADRAFASLGLPHKVVSIDDLPRVRIANIKLLLQVRASRSTAPPAEIAKRLVDTLHDYSVLSIAELAKECGESDVTPILQLIEAGVLHADLDRTLLANADSCRVSLNVHLLDPELTPISAAAFRVGTDRVPVLAQAERAIEILSAVKSNAAGRSIRRWKNKIKEGEALGLSPYQAVLPRTNRSGNRNGKRPPKAIDYAKQFLRENWMIASRPTVASVYVDYKRDAKAHHPEIAPVTRPTFYKMSKCLGPDGAAGRGGTRAKNAALNPTDVDERVIQSLRAFEIATCDHFRVDIVCVVLRTRAKKYTASPWLTVLRDCFTKAVLGYSLSFRKPSRLSCALVLRSCARRHGRLPEAIIVDHGGEFKSVYFASLMAHMNVDLMLRPVSHPRYGSEAERFFGHMRSDWLVRRPGNLVTPIRERSISSSHSAPTTSELTVVDLLLELQDYLPVFNDQIAPSQTASPAILQEESLERAPFSGRKCVVDQEFEVASAVDVRRISLDRARGLKVNGFWYWHPSLAKVGVRDRTLSVRVEPENKSVVYAQVSDAWVRCLHSGASVASTTDPVRRLADAIVFQTALDVREEAKEDANDRLYNLQQQADARFRQSQNPDPVDDAPTEDFFSQLSDADFSELTALPWRDL